MTETADDDRLLTAATVAEWTTLARTQIAKMVERGEFPPPVRLTERRYAWRRSDVQGWLKSRVRVQPA